MNVPKCSVVTKTTKKQDPRAELLWIDKQKWKLVHFFIHHTQKKQNIIRDLVYQNIFVKENRVQNFPRSKTVTHVHNYFGWFFLFVYRVDSAMKCPSLFEEFLLYDMPTKGSPIYTKKRSCRLLSHSVA